MPTTANTVQPFSFWRPFQSNIVFKPRVVSMLEYAQSPACYHENKTGDTGITDRQLLVAMERATRGTVYDLSNFLQINSSTIRTRLGIVEDDDSSLLPIHEKEFVSFRKLDYIYPSEFVGEILCYSATGDGWDHKNDRPNRVADFEHIYSALGKQTYGYGWPHPTLELDNLLVRAGLSTAKLFLLRASKKLQGITLPTIYTGTGEINTFPDNVGMSDPHHPEVISHNRNLTKIPHWRR